MNLSDTFESLCATSCHPAGVRCTKDDVGDVRHVGAWVEGPRTTARPRVQHEHEPVVRMNDKQLQMIQFEKNWYPLGGGSAKQITEEFGVSDRDFFAELDRLVDTDPPETLSDSELRRMRQVIKRRLWMAR